MGQVVGQPEPFEFSGGALCLDLANTLGDRPHCEQEKLAETADFLRWAAEAGILDPRRRSALERAAARGKPPERAALRRVVRFREALYRIFAALAAGGDPVAEDLAELNHVLAAALRRLRVEAGDRGFGWAWSEPPTRVEHLLWPVARSAAELLTSAEASLVRECASDRCSWLFVDRSRNHRRRWCDMKVCGNRAKARRHYRRQKQERSSASSPPEDET